ncbi:hypothetical protein MKW98_018487 [Papaver atlanticum]|uniref:Uncharacterized protein n=1 Tax=Papaver atlanticum TaxID=357466 RepID=A0AAD4TGA0_9MAGN|nr:hypothetical protein MKW98_018487 [Papaver atlanticum]
MRLMKMEVKVRVAPMRTEMIEMIIRNSCTQNVFGKVFKSGNHSSSCLVVAKIDKWDVKELGLEHNRIK